MRFMGYDEEFLLYILLPFFGRMLKNPKQNFITSLCLIQTDSEKQGMESDKVIDYVTNYVRIANVSQG